MKKKQRSLIRKSINISIHEGVYAQIFTSLVAIGNSFITKFAVLLNAMPIHFSILSAISQLTQIFQLFAIVISRKLKTRKKACIQFAFWSRALNLLLFIPLLIINAKLAILIFLLILLVSSALQNISGNIWTAWISDLIPKNFRGRFFSKRMQILLFFSLLIGYLFSIFVDLFEASNTSFKYRILERLNLLTFIKPEYQTWALYLVFFIGTIIGLIGLNILKKQPEKDLPIVENQDQLSVLEPLKNSNFRKLAFFNIWWMLAIGIGSPFWGPFMMKTLEMSLFEIQLYSTIQSISMLFAFKWWGKFIDKFGNKSTMKICVFIGGINPLIWLFFSKDSYSLIWFEAIISGFMWSGTNIVAMNFVLSIAPKGKEQVWSGMYGAIGGLMMMTTMLLSGTFFPNKMTILGLSLQPEQVLFGITGLLRWTAEIPLHYVKEAEAVPLRNTLPFVKNKIMGFIFSIKNKI